ncbi:MAG: uroporphyrinogen-III C-methyltransferase [Porticoccaceae bacterium]|nr:uroporphyrinogen-III C-methyltransferase [Porticoccaceae bacterium]
MTELAKSTSTPNSKQSAADTKVSGKKSAVKNAPTKKPKSSFGFLKAFAQMLVIVFIVLATSAGWFFWKDWQAQAQAVNSNSSILASLTSSINSTQDQSQAVIKQQRQQQQTAVRLESQLQNIELRVNAQGKRLVELGSTTRSDWLLAEAEYLARLARQRLQTERSVKSPLALLESVDVILTQIDDPNLLAARSAVADDITSLRLASDVDREGIYLELQALASSVEELSLVELAEPEVLSEKPVERVNKTKQTVLDEFLTDLSGLIRVRQRQNPIEPMLRPEEERIVRRNMQMIFEQAQVALLREEQRIYQAALEKAQNYLQRFFQSNPSSEAVSQRLAVLLETSIIQQLPDIYRSLDGIQSLLIMREQRLLETETTDQLEVNQ